MYKDRLDIYRRLEGLKKTKVLVYITGDRRGLETRIATEVIPYLTHHLDIIGDVDRISLFLYTPGGDVLASWSIVNLIRQFCDDFVVIIPLKAHSSGTLICLGADRIVMTKQATLSPIDPSVNTPLNPSIPGAAPNARLPVGVEAVDKFLEFARTKLGEEADLTSIILSLSEKVHPLVLGQAYRSRAQIRMLATKLLNKQISDDEKIINTLEFLCGECLFQ